MSSDDWERFKAIILHRYLLENIPVREVACYMEREHNFSKKKSQYEYQFKKWGVKKYAKKKDWENARHQLERRAGKQSEVTLFGVPLPSRSVRKKTQRYTPIPTAVQFGKRLPSSESLDSTIVRAQSPIIIENIIWPALPWFHFKNRVIPRLRDPSILLRTLSITLGSAPTGLQYHQKRESSSLFGIFRNPDELRRTIFHLTNAIPDDDVNGQQETNTLAQGNSSLRITKEALKLIFFRLSNKMLPSKYGQEISAHDQFVVHLVEEVSRTDPEMLSHILFDGRVTSKAIGEAVYGSAIREKHYAIVSRLLESKSVNPDLSIMLSLFQYPPIRLKRGLLEANWTTGLVPMLPSMMEAAFTRDTRLAEMLLRAGASLGSQSIPTLELACMDHGNSTSPMEFLKLLDKYGIINDYLASCRCPYPGSGLISPIAISIAKNDDCTANFLIEKFLMGTKEASTSLPQYSERSRCRCCEGRNERGPAALKVDRMPLYLAITTGNEKIIERLLLPVISHPQHIPVRAIREAFLLLCLAGNANIASKLLILHSEVIILHDTRLMAPLAATAWNTENTCIAETLLRLGAEIGPTQNDGLAPIHVAASYGNTHLIQQLLLRGADCNVRYLKRGYEAGLMDLPRACKTALQFALEGENVEIVRLLMPHSRLLGRELMQAAVLRDDALISEFISKGADVTWVGDEVGESVLDVAVKTRNKALISHYFSSGGLYRSGPLWTAVEAAIKSKDHSIARQLASHRRSGEIDDAEAESLVLAISHREWDLVSLFLHDSFIPGSAGSQCYFSSNWDLTPLCAALLSENKPVIEAMTKRGYTLHCNDIWSLMEAANESIQQVFWNEFPLQAMDISFYRALLLHAIEFRNARKVREYVEIIDCLDFDCGPYIPTHAYESLSPLVLVARSDSIEILRILLDAGAGVDFIVPTSYERKPALHHAVIAGHLHSVKFLLDRGARVDPPARLRSGATPLQYSAINVPSWWPLEYGHNLQIGCECVSR